MYTEQEISQVVFEENQNEEQQLCIETCPGFNEAKLSALGDTYETKWCRNLVCTVNTRFVPGTRRLFIGGLCPKI